MVWSFSPVALLLVTGLVLLVLGLGVGAWLLSVSVGDPSPTAGTVMLAVVPFVLGVQTLLVALQLDIQATPNRPTMRQFSP
jgi:uncharacterized membrane protein